MSEQECPGVDAVCPLGVMTPYGGELVIRHTRNHDYQMGELRPLIEGKPIYGELVQVEGKPGEWCSMTPILNTKSGPALVNSKEYTDGWTNIFGHQTYGVA